MLQTGTKAPEFSLPDQNGVVHTLSDYAGKKLILYFYSKDNTGGCTKHAVGYSVLKEEYDKLGIAVIGVSKDSVASHKRFEEKQNLKITILSDEALSAIQAYDVWHEKKMAGRTYMGVVRTTYLIDETGMIIMANNKVKAATDAEKMLEALR